MQSRYYRFIVSEQGDKDKILVKPIKYPVILTKYNYTFSQISPYRYHFACNGITYHLQEIFNQRYFPPPQYKKVCFAQVYINPIPCKTISSKEITGKRGDTLPKPPHDALYTMFHPEHGLNPSSEGNDATKCCVYYIHVEIHKPDWIYH